MRNLLLAIVAVVGVAGCSGSALAPSSSASAPGRAPASSTSAPLTVPAAPAVAAAFNLYTHCGADWRTSFEGSYWDLEAPVTNPVGDPYQPGRMMLLDPQTARFDYELAGRGYSIVFRRHAADAPLKPPLGCD